MHYLHTFLMGTNVFNQWFACIMKLASLMNHISVGGQVCRGRIWSSNIWGPSLLGAEFVRGRVCQGPSLLGAEMSRNPWKYTLHMKNCQTPNTLTALVAVCRNIIFNNERIIWGTHLASHQDLFSNLYKMYQLFRIGHCLEILFFALTWR